MLAVAVFASVFVVCLALERWWPRRDSQWLPVLIYRERKIDDAVVYGPWLASTDDEWRISDD